MNYETYMHFDYENQTEKLNPAHIQCNCYTKPTASKYSSTASAPVTIVCFQIKYFSPQRNFHK